jgi:hypothetical protein
MAPEALDELEAKLDPAARFVMSLAAQIRATLAESAADSQVSAPPCGVQIAGFLVLGPAAR